MSPSQLSNSATYLCIDLCRCWTFVHTLIGFSLPVRLEKEHGKVNAFPCVHVVQLKWRHVSVTLALCHNVMHCKTFFFWNYFLYQAITCIYIQLSVFPCKKDLTKIIYISQWLGIRPCGFSLLNLECGWLSRTGCLGRCIRSGYVTLSTFFLLVTQYQESKGLN